MTTHPALGDRWFTVTASTGAVPVMLFCENETNNALLFDSQNASPVTKDGINDFVVHGDAAAVNTTAGSKAAAHVHASMAPGETLTVTIRFAPLELAAPFDDADAVLARPKAEADVFYNDVAAADLSADERLVQRQALAGLLWCKQFYSYSVRRWLQGDPGQPPPPRWCWSSRNSDWQHLVVSDVILMPDAWEYPGGLPHGTWRFTVWRWR